MIGFLAGLVDFSRRRAALVLVASLVVTVLCAVYAQRNLGINTDTSHLISPDAGWQKQAASFDKAFPQDANVTTIVIDGTSADAVADGTTALPRRSPSGRTCSVRCASRTAVPSSTATA